MRLQLGILLVDDDVRSGNANVMVFFFCIFSSFHENRISFSAIKRFSDDVRTTRNSQS